MPCRRKCPFWEILIRLSQVITLKGMRRSTRTTGMMSLKLKRPGGIFTSKLWAMHWRKTILGEARQYAIPAMEGWTKEDCKSFRPALACLLDKLQKEYLRTVHLHPELLLIIRSCGIKRGCGVVSGDTILGH